MNAAKTLLTALLLAGAVFAGSAQQAQAQQVDLTGEELALVAQAEVYLNAIYTMEARFLQVAPSGEYSEGTIYMSRPGRMRLVYDEPSPILVVADGIFLIYYDKSLDQVSHVYLDASPAGILLREGVELNGPDVVVVKVVRNAEVVEISVIQAADPGAGVLTLVFAEKPFTLKQWRVLDAQGELTTVSLYESHTGVDINEDLFKFSRPKGP